MPPRRTGLRPAPTSARFWRQRSPPSQPSQRIRTRSTAILLLVVLPLGFAGIWRLQHGIDKQLGALNEEQDQVLLRSGKMMKLMSLEYAPLMADIYWTRVVQYYGSKGERHEQNLDSLWPLLDLTTTLDPNLLPAYRFGSTFLAEARPVGAGSPERAVELIERGIHENPDYWRLYQDLGPQGLTVIAVSIDTEATDSAVRAFATKRGLTFTILRDSANHITQQYQTTGVPETFVIGRDGIIRKKVIGASDWDSPGDRALVTQLLREPAS